MKKCRIFNKGIKAVGLFSGGLDSCLAVKVVQNLGVEVCGIFFVMPWGGGEIHRMKQLAGHLGIVLKIVQMGEDYLEILKAPRRGYGKAFNPCVDCHLYMIKKAAAYMKKIRAHFVFTGEVLGQRPMSQRKECLTWIEENSGLEGRLLRPLSAKWLEPSIPEKKKFIDRCKLLDFKGRSRREQLRLAQKWDIKGFSAPGGGCLLTDKHYVKRIKDMLTHGVYRYNEIAILKCGRYFRINEKFYAIIGRNHAENERLLEYAEPGAYIFKLSDNLPGPVAVLKGKKPPLAIRQWVAALVQRFSKYRDGERQFVDYWLVKKNKKEKTQQIKAVKIKEAQIKRYLVC